MKADIIESLARAMRERALMRFSTRYDEVMSGYVLDVGPKFFLIATVDDRIRLDGFECFRTRDVKRLIPDPHAQFAEAALAARGETFVKPSVEVSTLEDLLRSANTAFPLVTIHCEGQDAGVCWIGRALKIDHRAVSLLEIKPGAVWDGEPTEYRLADITRVAFGSDYEEALHLVGGDPVSRPFNSV